MIHISVDFLLPCMMLCVCAQSCPTLCDPMDCSLPGSSVHGISQARTLEWVAIPFSRGPSWSRDQTQVSCTAGGFFTLWATREAPLSLHVPYFSCTNRCAVTCHQALNLHFSNGEGCYYFFLYLFAIHIPSVSSCFVLFLIHSFVCFHFVLLFNFESFIYSRDRSPLSDTRFANIFS